MKVLVAYTSRYGATQGIAERIGATLRREGLEATVKPAAQAGDPAEYDSAVIGSAAYYLHWMKPSTDFVRRNLKALSQRPVWLFSSGPLGAASSDEEKKKRQVPDPREVEEFRETIHPRGHHVFFGAMDPGKLGFFHRLLSKLPVNRGDAIFPLGDFRDWNEIDAWALGIAQALKTTAANGC
jgi:menaquinone-dependent protoporphyrinogen oxidase